MRYGRYQFRCVFEGEAILPQYKGSTFRGVFGHALKRVVCALKRQTCEDCLLKDQCLYTRIFETRGPHPFVIEPPDTRQTRFSKGDAFDFQLLVFGAVNDHLPYFIYAFDQMGRLGVGRRIEGQRGQFSLREVVCGDQVVYSAAEGVLHRAETERLAVDSGDESSGRMTRLTVRLETPLRFKRDNRISGKLPFHVLVRLMLRRAKMLMIAFGDGEPELDYSGLVHRAEGVAMAENRLRWFDWERFSQRQGQRMYMGGLVGSVTYEGDFGPYRGLLEMGEKVHLGKQTTFGLGKVGVGISESGGVVDWLAWGGVVWRGFCRGFASGGVMAESRGALAIFFGLLRRCNLFG